jgi:hypothetical protein
MVFASASWIFSNNLMLVILFFVVGNDVVVFDTCKGVAVLEVAVNILTESFITSHLYSSEVVTIARTIVGRLVVGRERGETESRRR